MDEFELDQEDQFAPFVRSAYNYDMDSASLESALRCEDLSLAVQSALEETDINTIVRRFGLTGQLPEDVRAPQYGDFTEVLDYQSALNAVKAADDSFMQMPADVRARFHNDPGEFVDFVANDANREEAKKLGLLMPDRRDPEPVPVRVMVDPAIPPKPV